MFFRERKRFLQIANYTLRKRDYYVNFLKKVP